MLKVGIAITAVAALSGCKTTNDIRALQPITMVHTTQSVDQVAGCLALAFAKYPGVEVRSEALPQGTSVAMKMRVAGVASTTTVADIIRGPSGAVVTIRSVGANPDKPKPLNPNIQACL